MSVIFMRSGLPETVELLIQSPYRFYLTGSRFFGTSNSGSDWDFFIQDEDTITQFLLSNGFILETESYQQDPLIVKVYKRDIVHVQLVNNAIAKAKVQTRLSPVFQRIKPDKEHAKLLWSEAMQLYRDGVDGATTLKFKPF